MAEASYFWVIVGPLGFTIFAVCFILSVLGYRKGSAWMIFVGALVSAAVAYMAMWSIGFVFAIVSLLQLVAAVYLIFSKKR
jgi:hypothetical protein